MTSVGELPDHDGRNLTISDVIEEFGVWKVFVIVSKEILRRKLNRHVIHPSSLTTHLRRDVGLPSEPGEARNWDLG